MRKYKLFNNLLGWITFAIAAIVYTMTIEPTASFWDCGEFISSAYKLEVGHPPGAPFFMITGRIFATLASDPSKVAMMINIMSAIFSALTILFLFWSITHLAKAVVVSDKEKDMTLAQGIMILGSGLVGALVYTFSDTFWFSAVEGEVYAYSSLFT
ncbi:MAG: glycosyltransferase family 117 protein, partial [Bacteroidales bacterium]